MAEKEALVGAGKPTVQDVVDALDGRDVWQADLLPDLQKLTGLKDRAMYTLIKKAIDAGVVRVVREGQNNARLLRASGKLQPRKKVADAGPEGLDEDA
jgi:hypothetical protein